MPVNDFVTERLNEDADERFKRFYGNQLQTQSPHSNIQLQTSPPLHQFAESRVIPT